MIAEEIIHCGRRIACIDFDKFWGYGIQWEVPPFKLSDCAYRKAHNAYARWNNK